MFRRSAAAPALSRQLALSQETAVGAPSAAYSRLVANLPAAWVKPASSRSICRRQSIIASPRAAGGASAKKATTASAAEVSIAIGSSREASHISRQVWTVLVTAVCQKRWCLAEGDVGGELGQDLFLDRRPVPVQRAGEIAEGPVQPGAAVDHQGPAMGEGHQVSLVASALGPPGKGPARRERLVDDLPLPLQLLLVDLLHHLAHQAIELGQDLGQLLAIVLDPAVQLEVGWGHGHRAR